MHVILNYYILIYIMVMYYIYIKNITVMYTCIDYVDEKLG